MSLYIHNFQGEEYDKRFEKFKKYKINYSIRENWMQFYVTCPSYVKLWREKVEEFLFGKDHVYQKYDLLMISFINQFYSKDPIDMGWKTLNNLNRRSDIYPW